MDPDDAIDVQVMLFAGLREICGAREVHVRLPDGSDPRSCFDALADRHPGVRNLEDRLMVAVNESYADWDEDLEQGDVVTFIPPVSGG